MCEIFTEKNIVNKVPEYLKKAKLGKKHIVVTDSKILRLYGNAFLRFLKKDNIDADIISFDEGEKNKNIKTIEFLAEKLLEKNADRTSVLISLGGGVVGDITGFLASIFMRGIPYIQIPTTLLAMVDSSIGGKTGVNLPSGKNLIGTFNQPKAVFIDTNYLKTLPATQIKNGLAEVIKTAIIKDKNLFNFIEQNLQKILKLDPESLNKIITQTVKIKEEIVKQDEKEENKRMTLNYGHTYGHAIEKMSNYKLLHGYAVSIGMVITNKIAVEKKLLSKKDSERIKNLLKTTGLPVVTLKKTTFKDLKNDKKKQNDTLNLILPTKIGKAIIYKEKWPK